MITAALILMGSSLVTGILAPLPTGHLALPDPSSIGGLLGEVDSLIPILGPLGLATTILAALAVFLLVRMVFVAWQNIKW
jgi:hypothetical protein